MTVAAALPAAATLGGKARNLLELQRAGFRVPEFECSPSDLRAAVERLGFPLVVRSSATVEDGKTSSFAGQFETFLNLETLAQVETAVERCRASLSASSVHDYCSRHRIDPATLSMGFIVQRMLRPELAGVAFTVNPVTGEDEVVIEAVEGLADTLLAGRASPLLPGHPLVARYAAEIARVARRIHHHFGAPQDIEFAVEHGELSILQTRPITRIAFAADIGEWTTADFRDGGVSSSVCTPLMWSLYDFIWEDTLKGFLREIRLLDGDFQAGRLFFGRPYWNLGAVKNCLLELPGFVEREFDDDLSVQVTYEGKGRRTPITVAGIVRAVPTIIAIESIWKRQAKVAGALLGGGFEALIQPFSTVQQDVEDRFERLVREAYRTVESNYFRTIFCASLAKLDFKDSFPDAEYAALVGGLPPLRHLEPALAIREMAARGATDIGPLIERFGHHSRRELDLRAPRWDEDRAWVERLVQQASTRPVQDSRAAYERAKAAALAALPWHRRRRFARKLDRLRTFVWLREEMRDLSSRMYHAIRRHVVAIAERRGLGDDIFFMTFGEVLADDRANVAANRERYDRYRNFDAPHEIGARFPFGRRGEETPDGGSGLRGIPVSHGSATGIARVARTVEEAASLEKDEVLVCVFTDPGWTAVLDRAAAVVTETGGLLSHAAVICREYGIPAVLGVPGATSRIISGRRVRVDGTLGQVELIV